MEKGGDLAIYSVLWTNVDFTRDEIIRIFFNWSVGLIHYFAELLSHSGSGERLTPRFFGFQFLISSPTFNFQQK